MFPDYYKILKVPYSASLYDIKKSYRKLMLTEHPDVNSQPNHELIISIQKAYKTLINEKEKYLYDIKLINNYPYIYQLMNLKSTDDYFNKANEILHTLNKVDFVLIDYDIIINALHVYYTKDNIMQYIKQEKEDKFHNLLYVLEEIAEKLLINDRIKIYNNLILLYVEMNDTHSASILMKKIKAIQWIARFEKVKPYIIFLFAFFICCLIYYLQ